MTREESRSRTKVSRLLMEGVCPGGDPVDCFDRRDQVEGFKEQADSSQGDLHEDEA